MTFTLNKGKTHHTHLVYVSWVL